VLALIGLVWSILVGDCARLELVGWKVKLGHWAVAVWLKGLSCNSIGENMIKVFFPFTSLNVLYQNVFIVEQGEDTYFC
jgi:hypothetical protein